MAQTPNQIFIRKDVTVTLIAKSPPFPAFLSIQRLSTVNPFDFYSSHADRDDPKTHISLCAVFPMIKYGKAISCTRNSWQRSEEFHFPFQPFSVSIQMQIPFNCGVKMRLINGTCSIIKLSRGSIAKRDEMEAAGKFFRLRFKIRKQN